MLVRFARGGEDGDEEEKAKRSRWLG